MPQQTCTATNKNGDPCWAVTWELQVGTGPLAKTVARSDEFCIRHDLKGYDQALRSLDPSQGKKLRYAVHRKRWAKLRPDSG